MKTLVTNVVMGCGVLSQLQRWAEDSGLGRLALSREVGSSIPSSNSLCEGKLLCVACCFIIAASGGGKKRRRVDRRPFQNQVDHASRCAVPLLLCCAVLCFVHSSRGNPRYRSLTKFYH